MDFSHYYCCSWFNLSPQSPTVCLSRLLAPGTLHAGAGGSRNGGTQRFWGQHKVVITGGAVPSVRGAGIPTASEAARWPLPHPSWGQCHHRNRCWLRVGGPCDVAAAQPTRSQGHSSPLPGSTQKPQVTPKHPLHAHPLVTLVWAGQHSPATLQLHLGPPGICPALGWGSPAPCASCARLCPPGQPDPARQLCCLGHRPKT